MVTVVCGIAIMMMSKRRRSLPEQVLRESHEVATTSQPLFIAFVVFAVVMFFTPGPNNIMLLSSGLTYGFRRTLPHIAGIAIGVAFMVGAVGIGLGDVFIACPVLQTILKYRRRGLPDLSRGRDRDDEPARPGRTTSAAHDVLGRGRVPMG